MRRGRNDDCPGEHLPQTCPVNVLPTVPALNLETPGILHSRGRVNAPSDQVGDRDGELRHRDESRAGIYTDLTNHHLALLPPNQAPSHPWVTQCNKDHSWKGAALENGNKQLK